MTTKRQLKLGDAVAKIAKALHIPHCEKCEQRRRILNEIRTLGVRETIKKLKAVELSESKNTSESWSIEEIIQKMEDCCDEK
ncbi:MAG: hypothetical protein HYX23_00660 [Candidatus Zambryskibacteria bacterium]|nr:hypothetical protein [Candidatus Zambryskibacteria bacterium]